MAQFQKLSLAMIVVPERIRPVDDEHAKALAQSMAREGLMNPITVRHTPNAKEGNYTLIAGAHRLRAAELLGYSDIDAVVVQADKDNAALLEVAENLFRNELSVIDRALFVQTYRELWEKKYGEIKIGRNKKSKVQVAPIALKDSNTSSDHNEIACEGDGKSNGQVDRLIGGDGHLEKLDQVDPIFYTSEESGAKGITLCFSKHVADRIGLSQVSVKRLNSIAQHLQPELRAVLRGTALADNQAQLLKLAKMEPVAQRRVAVALQQNEGDLRRAVDLVNGINISPQINEQERIFAQLLGVWQRADAQTKARFCDYLARERGEVVS
ncbi:ParB/RepB/Spo0J family partition protein [Bartonella vinsonii]|uniref:Chromosome partitioning protein, ParB family n=1 Tax=Bartonella vinsonii subsp. berkhoffii str. Tweed TaxID=1094502 RepID=N6UZT2_BARVB|nr:ParB/RepB/Spo0J family partition protein [Bartonella vinsonii]ENN95548.1 chromosome partitioning protein, ParB family [Bartonella vinsonii subsp. berkhoffii str. Tweed]